MALYNPYNSRTPMYGEQAPVYQPYSYNQQAYPYFPPQRPRGFQPEQQPMQQQAQNFIPEQGIIGRVVKTQDSIVANDVPMDGSIAVFPLQDLSAIFAKRWNADGTICTVTYKPTTEQGISNSPHGVESGQIALSDEATGAFMKRFDEISDRLTAIEQSMAKAPRPIPAKAKKEEQNEST